MRDYENICVKILEKYGPLLGSELQKKLMKQSHISPTNARQICYRLKNEDKLLTTDPVKFTGNQVLYFLPRQDIRKKVKLILPNHAKTYHRLYQAFVEQDGFLLMSEFSKISAGIVDRQQEPNKRHKSVDKIFDEMVRLGLISKSISINETEVIIASDKWVPQVTTLELSLYVLLNH